MIYIAITFFIFIIITIYFAYRNNKVYNFRVEIISNNYDGLKGFVNQFDSDEEYLKYKNTYRQLRENSNYIINKVSYDSMWLSFKPLKLENWYTSEEISFIKYLWKFKNG